MQKVLASILMIASLVFTGGAMASQKRDFDDQFWSLRKCESYNTAVDLCKCTKIKVTVDRDCDDHHQTRDRDDASVRVTFNGVVYAEHLKRGQAVWFSGKGKLEIKYNDEHHDVRGDDHDDTICGKIELKR